MRFIRSIVVGTLVAGVASALALFGAGTASAVEVTPLPGGVRVDLDHAESAWVYQNGIGFNMAKIPHPSARSFGSTLSSATGISSGYPDGRVSFTVYGPIDAPHGGMVVFKD
ncbi:hypothetical protein [Skermania piniformis]|uniref:Uncharacterized protein n=1 Tax=Skermania pinensis TaxID=39122 RepID=A0ABX8SAW3_9ACTN|nr:hypothetical protein [Skermania piniformis]QXQ15009.1 hypothetical protein KV203_06535 [Skermania piniformis]